MKYFFLQAQDDVTNGDMAAAGRRWRTGCQWPYLGVILWVTTILTIELSLVIVFAVVFGTQ